MTSKDNPNMTLHALTETAPEATVTVVATRWGMGGGTLGSVYGFLTSNEAVILIGILVTISGFIVNLIYQRRRDRREIEDMRFRRELEIAEETRRAEKHRLEMAALGARSLSG